MGLITSAKMIGSYAARLLAAADTDIYALLLVRIDRLEERVGRWTGHRTIRPSENSECRP